MDQLLTILLFASFALIALVAIIVAIRLYSNYERSLNMVFLKVQVPQKESKEDRERESEAFSSGKDFKEVVGIMSHFFSSLHSIYGTTLKEKVKGQEFLSFEYAVLNSEINFFIVCPRNLESLIEKQLTSFYPDCFIERVQDYNIFRKEYKVTGTYMRLIKESIIPFKTYNRLNSDPVNSIINVLSKFKSEEGAAIQMMIRPKKRWLAKQRTRTCRRTF